MSRRCRSAVGQGAGATVTADSELSTVRGVYLRSKAESEGVLVNRAATRCDDARARSELGIAPRPLPETVRDAVAWLHRAGHLSARQAGAAASAPAGQP